MTGDELDQRVQGSPVEEGEGEPETEVIGGEETREPVLEEEPVPLEEVPEEVPLKEARPGLEEVRETTAQWLAYGVIIIFGVTVFLLVMFSFVGFWVSYFHSPAQETAPIFDAINLAETLLPYLATPLGVALGYYFSKRAAGR